ncbi:MAG: class C beta-lactamase-related serine hydrolase [Cytophagales bacterium]|nr:MAG: class C beta-lactamase-related serine hydrolase [Cytophagales bacterium]
MKKIYTILSIFWLSLNCQNISAQAVYFPDAAWKTKTPEELKLDKKWLDSAVSMAINNENKVDRDLRIAILKAYVNEPNYKIIGQTKTRSAPAGVIIKNGYIVAQWGDIQRVDMSFSATKSFLSTVGGLAVDNGLIGSVQDKVSNYVWDDSFEGEHNAKITWEHLLTQSSDWSGTLFGLHDWADRPPKEGKIDDWKSRKFFEPGANYEYNDVRVNLLAYSLLQVWRQPLPVVLREKLMNPIGASTTWRWFGYENSFVNVDGIMVQSVSGGGHHGGGLFINSLDMARFGLLFARKGKWNGQQLISEKWINAARQPSSANKSYGYLWWTNLESSWKNVPTDIYYAAGFGGNYIVVDEKHDLVVVARWIDDTKMNDFISLIIRAIENK